MMVIPLFGILIGVLVYLYMKKIYRRVVAVMNQTECYKYSDIEFKLDAVSGFEYPVYLKEIPDSFDRDERQSFIPKATFHE